MENKQIHVVTGCVLNEQQQLLVVRKRGTQRFMLPGGKPEIDEKAIETLCREWHEELGIKPCGDITLLGRFSAPAANEPNHIVIAQVFLVSGFSPDSFTCAAEIEEYRWITLNSAATPNTTPNRNGPGTIALAPLLETRILPYLKQRLGIGTKK